MSNIETKHYQSLKPDAVERNLDNENQRNCLQIKVLKLSKIKKIQINKSRSRNNFIKFMKLNLFIMIYVLILSSGPIGRDDT